MSRGQRVDFGNLVYHVINRSNGCVRIFNTEADYRDFEYLLSEIKEEFGMRILAYVVMPNHWHLLLYPNSNGDLSRSMHWLATSHAHRHQSRTKTVGEGHLYQGRYKSFLIEEDQHLLTVLKYIERNPVRAKLVENPKDWPWGSAYRRLYGTSGEKALLADLPVDMPRNYIEWIRIPELAEELKGMRDCVNKGWTFGNVVIETTEDITT